MRRLVILFLLSLTAMGAYACGGSAPEPAASAGGDEVCPLLDAGPPPACPEGCAWNGKECRKQGGIIIYDHKAKASSDAGRRPDASNNTM
jgi:hypothetical protein